MSKQAVDAPKTNLFMMLPEDLTLIEDHAHPLYDVRITLPLDEGLVNSIMAEGVELPLLARKNGDQIEVVDGIQRTRAARRVNDLRVQEGAEPIRIPVRMIRVEEGKLTGMKWAANIHIDDPPAIRAKKVSDAINRLGMTREQVALAMGQVSTQSIDNWLAFNDLSAKVQTAITDGKISETAARNAGLHKLERDKQDETLSQMIDKGLTKGAAATRAGRRARTGKPLGERPARGTGKMRQRSLLEAMLDHLDAYPSASDPTKLIAIYTRWLLGDNQIRAKLPNEVLECIAAAMGDLK